MNKSGGKFLYATSLVALAFSLAEFVFMFLPRIEPLAQMYDVIEFFVALFFPTSQPFNLGTTVTRYFVGLILFWISSFAAIGAFTRKTDGVSVWRAIAADSCRLPGEFTWRTVKCVTPKWLATILLAPILIAGAAAQRIFTESQLVSIGYITIDPALLISYLKRAALAAAALMTLFVWVFAIH